MVMRLMKTLAVLVVAALTASPLMGGCSSDGSDGAAGAAGAPGASAETPLTDTYLDESENLPGVVLTIVSLSGASGAGGQFQVGNSITINFTLTKNDGTALLPTELNSSGVYVSGPTYNYNRVIASTSNWHLACTENADGSWSYTIPTAIPATYLAPYNDTTDWPVSTAPDGTLGGEWTGSALQNGTYTVGFQAYKNYTGANAVNYRDVGNAWKHFLFGTATVLDTREVVKTANCNQCHGTLQIHGGGRRNVELCILCHTSGGEDSNTSVDRDLDGDIDDIDKTRGAYTFSIDFRVMIHKIHNAAHLPSVLGVQTDATGARTYGNTPKPYRRAASTGFTDFTEIAFPVWPNLSYAMPRNAGYSALSSTNKSTDDKIRTGAADCSRCHGDPDGSGPLTAPSQGSLAYDQPTRRACGSCHDDIQWSLDNGSGRCFKKNDTLGMTTQLNDATCVTCHVSVAATDPLKTDVAHLHPLKNTTIFPGLKPTVTAKTPSSGATLETGETLSFTFTMTTDAGGAINPTTAASTVYLVIAGPTYNRNLVHYTSFSSSALGTGAGPYTVKVPRQIGLEYIGNAGAGPFLLGNPVLWGTSTTEWNPTTSVWEVTPPPIVGKGNTTLTVAIVAGGDFATVAEIANFHKGDTVVLDYGVPGAEEYLTLAAVISDTGITTGPGKLYFTGTSTYNAGARLLSRFPHGIGVAIQEVTLTARTVTTQWTVSGAAPATITEVAGFTPGNHIVSSYLIDWTLPAVYPPAFGDTTDIADANGDWGGKSIVDGRYTLGLWSAKSSISVTFPAGAGEATSYTGASLLATGGDFYIGAETGDAAYGLISAGSNCTVCHTEPQFHGGSRRGGDTCLLCHGQAGAEDGPQRIWTQSTATTPVYPLATTGTSINMRTMLHKIHMGKELFNAATYAVVGNGGTAHYYDAVGFPTMPGGVKHCDKCHGTSNSAWKEPQDRSHPTQQVGPMRRWRPVCGSCHDKPDNNGHFDLMTSAGGEESCGTCHGVGKVYNVELMHKNR